MTDGALDHDTDEWEAAYRSLVLAPRVLTGAVVPVPDAAAVVGELVARVSGFGPLQPFLDDPEENPHAAYMYVVLLDDECVVYEVEGATHHFTVSKTPPC